jgi:NADPH:quinone reductase-like Zn-dependent oxidoreductase
MRAVMQRRYGSPDDLEVRDAPMPAVGDEDVLVKVRAASLHPDVWHVVTGRPYVLRLMGAGVRRPKNPIPGTDLAGVVETAGRTVTRFQPGDPVFGYTTLAYSWTNGGAFAEYTAVRQELLARKPGNVTFEQAAAVPASGYIALLNLRGGTVIRPGHEVLVNGAGGGVGTIALQIAKARGARVTAVDGPTKLGLLRALGADRVMDYTREDFTTDGARYDLIFDVPGNHSIADCRRALAPGGKYVIIGHEGFGASGKPVLGLIPRFFGLVFRSLFTEELRLGRSSIPGLPEAVGTLAELLEKGTLTPVIDRTYRLEEVREAFRRMIEGQATGKVIIAPTAGV